MKVTNRSGNNEVTFGDVQPANGFIYMQTVCLKVLLPDGKPAAVAVETGKTFYLSASTFVTPINLEGYYL
ncbi:hypothetical protein [Enterococcus faecium]|uniref:Uncharacterized protein n=1 Tax=Escherichia phage PGN829.1 TaxID=2315696 RepID=A0A385II45_9CAUD|nr:hypothetical protein [Enterococcus faecium]YP_010659690.1 hypothetical protein PP765_gp17 [Escherichia phage PGN829.1]AXY82551.1 hypothetical protein [Escherichia phage PGN829.1]MCH5412620.1 hypothetical protein [Enterococcus faecium]QHQ49146.1 hypothetical protein EI543_13625 [Enterococcus faecium]